MSQPRTSADCGGFTLLEVLIAVAIMSLAAVSVSFAFPGLRERSDLRLAAQRVESLLARARDEALRSQGATVVRFAPQHHRIGFPAQNVWYALPGQVGVTVLCARGLVASDEPTIVFLSDGSSSGGTIELRSGAHRAVRRVSWLTGRIDDGP